MHYPSALWQISPVALRSLVSHSSFCEGGKTDSLKVIFVLLCRWRSRSREHLQPPYTPHSITLPIFVGGAVFFLFSSNKEAFSLPFSPLLVQKVLPWSTTAGEVKKQNITKLALFISPAMCGIMFPRVRVHCVFLIWNLLRIVHYEELVLFSRTP